MPDGTKPFPADDLSNLLPPIDSYTSSSRLNYEYFEGSEKHPFNSESDAFDMINAWWLADAALLAYSDRGIIEYWCEKAGFTEFHWFSGNSTQCYVAATERYAFVVFRGTQA